MSTVIRDINKMEDADELQSIATAAKERIIILASKNFRVKSKVQLRPEHQKGRPFDSVGTIDKVNQKTFGIDFGKYGHWKVPKAMVQKAQ